WSRQAHKIARAARSHSLDIETREPPSTTNHEDKADPPSHLVDMDHLAEVADRQIPHAPRVRKKCRSDSKAHDIRQGIELLAELPVRSGCPGDPAIERVEQKGDADSPGRIVEVPNPTLECSQNCVISAQQVADRKKARQQINAAPQAVIARANHFRSFL